MHVRDLLQFHTCDVSHLVIIIEAFMAKCHKSGKIRSFTLKLTGKKASEFKFFASCIILETFGNFY